MTPDPDLRMAQSAIHDRSSNAIETTRGLVNHRSSVETKVALFRSLFRGREDVYPRRFESRRTRKAGYQPACANEWARGVCEKPRIKCTECPHRRFLPITDEVIRRHLAGRDDAGRDFVMGVYPVLQDDTCFLLSVDRDNPQQADLTRYCREEHTYVACSGALDRIEAGVDGAKRE